MKVIAFSIAIFTLTACGGSTSSSGISEQDIVFPEHLPKVNSNLSKENKSGIWMSYRVHKTTVRGANEDQNIRGEIIEIANEMAVVDQDEHETYTLQFCTLTEFREGYDQGFETLKNGYSYIYSGYENGPDTGSTGRINVTFLSNHKMYGLGHKKTPYLHLGQEIVDDEIIEFYAIKISDDMNFNDSDDLTYTSNMESLAGKESTFNPRCIGTYDRKIKIFTNDVVTYENHDKHIMQAGLDSPVGFDLYDAEGTSSESEEQKLVGGWYRHTGTDNKYLESQCDVSDENCLNEHKLELDVIQNNKSGLSFSARLDSSNGGFFNIQVSAIIHPVETSIDY
jgi:hypothetical protein